MKKREIEKKYLIKKFVFLRIKLLQRADTEDDRKKMEEIKKELHMQSEEIVHECLKDMLHH